MDDKETPSVEETDNPETSATEDTPQDQPAEDVEAIKRALRKANKEAEKFRLALKEREDAEKSEAQRLAEERDALAAKVAETEKRYLRIKIGADKKLPAEIAERLQGDTEDELREDADRLLALLKPGTPTGDAEGGQRGRTPDPNADMDALLRAAASGR